MRRYLLDSNAVTSLINHHESLHQRARVARAQGCRIGTCEPVVAELCYGLELSASRDQNFLRLRRALSLLATGPSSFRGVRTAGGGIEATGATDASRRHDARRHRPVAGECTVVTTDSDLLAVPGLSVENWERAEEPK